MIKYKYSTSYFIALLGKTVFAYECKYFVNPNYIVNYTIRNTSLYNTTQLNSKTSNSQNDKLNQHSFKLEFLINLDITPT